MPSLNPDMCVSKVRSGVGSPVCGLLNMVRRAVITYGKEHTADGSVLLVVVRALKPGGPTRRRDLLCGLTEPNEGVAAALLQCLPCGQLPEKFGRNAMRCVFVISTGRAIVVFVQ
jgi:hypothetical protein